MKTRQYVYFSLRSTSITAQEITATVGLEPDAILIRGSRSQENNAPRCHKWAIECRDKGTPIDDQTTELVRRLRPYATVLGELGRRPEVTATLQIVRYFNDEDGQEDVVGWHLDPETLSFLVSVSAGIDADEYE